MDEALFVGVVEAVTRLGENIEELVGVDRVRLQKILDRRAFDELHGEVILTAVLAAIDDLDDVRVVEADHGLGLALEARDEVAVAGEVDGQRLDRHPAVERGLVALVNDAHAAAGDLFFDLELAELPADEALAFPL